jgi:hypothetical protein
MVMGMTLLGQLDAPQALADIDGFRKLLPRVPNESLRKQLAQSADQCEKLLQNAMTMDGDVQTGVDCVTQLYEAFEDARRVPAAPAGPAVPGSTPFKIEDVGSTSATIIWIVAGGIALAGIASAVAG